MFDFLNDLGEGILDSIIATAKEVIEAVEIQFTNEPPYRKKAEAVEGILKALDLAGNFGIPAPLAQLVRDHAVPALVDLLVNLSNKAAQDAA